MTLPEYLHGVHDADGAHLMDGYPGWVVITEAIGRDPSDRSGRDYSDLTRRGLGVVVRLNHAHDGQNGTIPLPEHYTDFARRCANFCAASPGIAVVIIGNEPNHANEWVNGAKIDPSDYARCYSECRASIKAARPGLPVLVAAIAPWNNQSGDWLEFLKAVARHVDHECDGFALHAYTHGADPTLVYSEEKRNGWYWHFRTYRDQLIAIFEVLGQRVDGKLYLITETDQGDDPWLDADSGWVLNAYREIVDWNRGSNMPVSLLALYRSNRDDRWSFADKEGVKKDFRRAVERRYKAPALSLPTTPTQQVTTHLPSISTGAAVSPALPPREWDERLTTRGVTIETPPVAPGQQYFRVVKARWYNEQEAGGRRNIFVAVLTTDGRVVAGVPFVTTWADEAVTNYTKAGTGFEAGNFVMGKSLNEFSVRIDAGVPSEIVHGIGMGADGNVAIHTATELTFVLTTMPAAAPTPAPQTPVTVPTLAHPVQDPAKRVISQRFGDNPLDYAKFGLAGHAGLDFAVPEGTVVCAVDGGVVLEAGELPDYGMYIKLRHPWGESVYAHLSTIRVEQGMAVARGEPIALSGNTGNSTGPHLHYAMRVFPSQRGYPYDGFSDPAPYLINAGAPTAPTPTGDLLPLIKNAATKFGLEWQLLASLAWAESSWDADAVSAAGAKGLLQVMAATWGEWAPRVGASEITDPAQNLAVGAAYLAWLLRQTNGNAYRALHAYLWGIGNVLNDLPVPGDVAAYANKIVHGRDLLVAVRA